MQMGTVHCKLTVYIAQGLLNCLTGGTQWVIRFGVKLFMEMSLKTWGKCMQPLFCLFVYKCFNFFQFGGAKADGVF